MTIKQINNESLSDLITLDVLDYLCNHTVNSEALRENYTSEQFDRLEEDLTEIIYSRLTSYKKEE